MAKKKTPKEIKKTFDTFIQAALKPKKNGKVSKQNGNPDK